MAKAKKIPQPIPTRWLGCDFRSRLEAKWAIFFNALGIRWDYEPEGYELGAGLRYLPDFFLHLREPRANVKGYWVEIKPFAPLDSEIQKMVLLVKQTGHHGFIFCGLPHDVRIFYANPSLEWMAEDTEWPLKRNSAIIECSAVPGQSHSRAIVAYVGESFWVKPSKGAEA